LAHAALAREDWAALTNSSALTMGMMREIMAHQIAINEHLAEVRAESARVKHAENKTLGLTSVYTFLAIFGSAMAGKGKVLHSINVDNYVISKQVLFTTLFMYRNFDCGDHGGYLALLH